MGWLTRFYLSAYGIRCGFEHFRFGFSILGFRGLRTMLPIFETIAATTAAAAKPPATLPKTLSAALHSVLGAGRFRSPGLGGTRLPRPAPPSPPERGSSRLTDECWVLTSPPAYVLLPATGATGF